MNKKQFPLLLLIAALAAAPYLTNFFADTYLNTPAEYPQAEAEYPQAETDQISAATAANEPEISGSARTDNPSSNPSRPIPAESDFIYKIEPPLWRSSSVVFLLHGAGGNETSLMAFARKIWPRATLIGIRGHILQGKERRWYHKITATSFNQREAVQESDYLANFIETLIKHNAYSTEKITFLGYSNGANILALMAMRHPNIVRQAVLMRPMPILSPMPQSDLRNLRILTLAGTRDKIYGHFAEQLYNGLRQNGAHVTNYSIPATHLPGNEDIRIIIRWLKPAHEADSEAKP